MSYFTEKSAIKQKWSEVLGNSSISSMLTKSDVIAGGIGRPQWRAGSNYVGLARDQLESGGKEVHSRKGVFVG